MGSPDVVTQDGQMYDLKTVNVESKIRHTDWTVEIGDFEVCYDPSVDAFFNKIIKISNFINRLKRKKPTLESQLYIYKVIAHEI
jgi:hypothetical protein